MARTPSFGWAFTSITLPFLQNVFGQCLMLSVTEVDSLPLFVLCLIYTSLHIKPLLHLPAQSACDAWLRLSASVGASTDIAA